MPHREDPSVDALIEGESIHHIHFHGNHHSSNHWTLKLDMYKSDGSSPTVWVAQMEQYFSLNDIYEDGTKLHVGALYLDQERWKWWQWHQKCYPGRSTWNMFLKPICDLFDWESNFLGCLTKL